MTPSRWHLAFLFIASTAMSFASDSLAVPFRTLPLAGALKAAETEHKLVLIDFYTTWCGPCKMLDQQTWSDASVGKLLDEKTVPLRIDAEAERDLASKYAIRAYPTVLVLKPDGTEVDRLVGFRSAAVFTRSFTDLIAGKTPEMAAREKVTAPGASHHDQVQARYQLGQVLAEKGKSKEALDEYLWCFDEGMVKETSFRGVRVSFLLSSITELGESYPPAIEALRTRRDAAEKAMGAEATRMSAASDYAALNRELKEEDKTMALFDSLAKDDPRRAPLGATLFEKLVEAKRYDEAMAARPFKRMTRTITMMSALPPAPNDELKAAQQKYLTHSTAADVEVLIGCGYDEHAKALAAQLTGLIGADAAQGPLQAAAERAGKPSFFSEPAAPVAPKAASSPKPRPEE